MSAEFHYRERRESFSSDKNNPDINIHISRMTQQEFRGRTVSPKYNGDDRDASAKASVFKRLKRTGISDMTSTPSVNRKTAGRPHAVGLQKLYNIEDESGPNLPLVIRADLIYASEETFKRIFNKKKAMSEVKYSQRSVVHNPSRKVPAEGPQRGTIVGYNRNFLPPNAMPVIPKKIVLNIKAEPKERISSSRDVIESAPVNEQNESGWSQVASEPTPVDSGWTEPVVEGGAASAEGEQPEEEGLIN
jgi:hypothetical protein